LRDGEGNEGWIKAPSQNDVLFGRGKGIMDHPGNQFFRELIRNHKRDFIASSYHERKRFPQMIVDKVKTGNPPRRILKKDVKTELWYDVSLKEALAKTRQTLREDTGPLLDELASERYFTRRVEHANEKDKFRENNTKEKNGNSTNVNGTICSSIDYKDRKPTTNELDKKVKERETDHKEYPQPPGKRGRIELGVISFGATDHKRARSHSPEKPPKVCQKNDALTCFYDNVINHLSIF